MNDTDILITFQGLYDNFIGPVAIFDSKGDLVYSNTAFNSIKVTTNTITSDLWDSIQSNGNGSQFVLPTDQYKFYFQNSESKVDNHCFILSIGTKVESSVINKTDKEKKLQIQNNIKDRIFSIIAHDLKNPVGTLEQVSNMLYHQFDSFEPEELKDYINDIYITSRSTASLLETLLNWSHVQKGTVHFDPSDMNLKLMLDKCSELLSIKAKLKNIALNTEVDPDLSVWGDAKLIYTVFRNLITNSMKFTQSGGSISVSATTINNDYVEIEIKDNGIGMKPQKAKTLFNVGEVESTEGTDNESGTGLGLVLCKDFIEMHNGTIWAESELGKGTSIFFTLPVK
jgi:signal transduction histidine kinase